MGFFFFFPKRILKFRIDICSPYNKVVYFTGRLNVFVRDEFTSRCVEATPREVFSWTNGAAIVATGSPFTDVELNGATLPVSQCNNSYIFPGIGLAVVSCEAKRVTNNMLMAASLALAEASPLAMHGEGALLPPLNNIKSLSVEIAKRVAMAAIADGVAPVRSEADILACIQATQWQPEYREYQRVAS